MNTPRCLICDKPMRDDQIRYICLSRTSRNFVVHRFNCPHCGTKIEKLEILPVTGPMEPIREIGDE